VTASPPEGWSILQQLLARRKVLAPASDFINPPFGPFTDAELPALLAYLKKI
jgi:hypothetical protein